MRHHYIRAWVLFLLTVSAITTSFGQSGIDSVLRNRNNAFFDFRVMDESPGEKTWFKMTESYSRAKKLIEIDNVLINDYLPHQTALFQQLESKAETLNFELALLRKEVELQALAKEENRYTIKILAILLGGLGIIFIVLLILFIDRQIRYRSIKIEQERTWAIREELGKESEWQKDLQKLNKQIGELTLKNTSLISELEELKQTKREKEEILEREIQSKKHIEEEIKNLILQIKNP